MDDIYNSKYILITFVNTYNKLEKEAFFKHDEIKVVYIYPKVRNDLREIKIMFRSNDSIAGFVTEKELDRIYNILQREVKYSHWR